MQQYTQQNIYVQNFIRSKNYDFNPAYSELIGRLCGVEAALSTRESVHGFTSELMTVLQGSGFHSGIDRISLAARVGQSNELVVLDSCNTERAQSNVMPIGYRCFVSPTSSLFSLREGEIRLYDEALRIAEAFEKRHKPVQRSIGYIIQMGFHSGVCVPLHISGHLRGFLFFNSFEEGLFTQLADEDYAILNIIGIIAKLALASEFGSEQDYAFLRREESAKFNAELFDEDGFQEQLHAITRWQTGAVWRPKVETEGESGFLYSPANTAYIISKICSSLFKSVNEYPGEIRVVNRGDGLVRILVPSSDEALTATIDTYRTQVKALEMGLSFLHMELTAGINDVALQFPFDPVSKVGDDVRYSVGTEAAK